MTASASPRRQALAALARSRQDGDSGGRRARRIPLAIAILAILGLAAAWLLGVGAASPELLAVRAQVEERLADLARQGRNEAPFGPQGDSWRELAATMRRVPEADRDQARRELGRLFEARETAEIDSFFGLPPERRMAELDRRIRAEEDRRREWEESRDRRESARGGEAAGRGTGGPPAGSPAAPPTGSPVGGPGGWSGRRGDGTEENRNLRSKARIDRSTAESRARRTEYGRLKDQRRIELGLPAGR